MFSNMKLLIVGCVVLATSEGLHNSANNKSSLSAVRPANLLGRYLFEFLLNSLTSDEDEKEEEPVEEPERVEPHECGPPPNFDLPVAVNKRGLRELTCCNCPIKWHCFDIEVQNSRGLYSTIFSINPDYSVLPFMMKKKGKVYNHCVRYRMLRDGKPHSDSLEHNRVVCFETSISNPDQKSYLLLLTLNNHYDPCLLKIPTFVSEEVYGYNVLIQKDFKEGVWGVYLTIHLRIYNASSGVHLAFESAECPPNETGDSGGRTVLLKYSGHDKRLYVQDNAFGMNWDFELCFSKQEKRACLEVSLDLPDLLSGTKDLTAHLDYNQLVFE